MNMNADAENTAASTLLSLDEAELGAVVGGYAQTVGDLLNGMGWPPSDFPFPNPNDPDAPAPSP